MLRIEHGVAGERSAGFQTYLDRLIKLIPAEVVGVYLVGVGVIPAGQDIGSAAWTGVCFLVVILVRAKATRDSAQNLGPQWVAVAVSAVSFAIWAYTMGGPFVTYHLYVGWIGALAVLLWTFGVPYFYRGSLKRTSR
jgi:uncharacterized membrane protein